MTEGPAADLHDLKQTWETKPDILLTIKPIHKKMRQKVPLLSRCRFRANYKHVTFAGGAWGKVLTGAVCFLGYDLE